MKHIKTLLLSLAASALLVACGNNGGGDPGASSDSSATTSADSSASSRSSSEAETYVIKVNAPSGVEYSLSKTRAAKGEEVTLTITSVASGVTVTKVTMNNVEIEAARENVYTFTMPDASAIIKISVDVQGDVTLYGGLAAVLNRGEDGIYVARNVKIEGGEDVFFGYQITGEDDEKINLSSLALDEFRCMADVNSTFGNEYPLSVAGGCTYDFFYDPSSDYPCYVRRVSVDYLPSTVENLYTLFDGHMRSESTVHYGNLKSMAYSVKNREDSNQNIYVNYNYRVYENGVSFGIAEDTLNEETYYTYKHYDRGNATMQIVDTYTKAMGNNDTTRLSANNYGAHAANFDVVDLYDRYDTTRSQLTARDAEWYLNTTAHLGYDLEREFMYAYRVGFGMDEVSSQRINISSVKDEDNIVTTIDSYVEYDATSGTYTTEIHEAHKFNVTITFDEAGRVLGLNFVKTRFSKNQWDFHNHAPATGETGTKVNTITMTCEYGDPFEGAPEFDVSPYFLNEVHDLRFFDPATGDDDIGDASRLHYNDKVKLNRESENDKNPHLVSFDYSPVTALDVWQYGPTASSNAAVIDKTPSDLSFVMTCVGVGESDVTFGNYTQAQGITFTDHIEVVATQKFHSIYLNNRWGEYYGTDAWNAATIVAGQLTSFQVGVTPSSAPIIYNAQSQDESLLKIIDADGNPGTGAVAAGKKLTLDATGAASITQTTTVSVVITSEWFTNPSTSVTFYFTIVPMAADVTGTEWGMTGYQSHVTLSFTTDASAKEGYDHVGHLVDDGYQDGGTYGPRLEATFAYSYTGGQILATVTAISITGSSESWSQDASDYTIAFGYDATSDRVGLFLAEVAYDSYYEDYVISPLFGDVDGEGNISSMAGFERIN